MNWASMMGCDPDPGGFSTRIPVTLSGTSAQESTEILQLPTGGGALFWRCCPLVVLKKKGGGLHWLTASPLVVFISGSSLINVFFFSTHEKVSPVNR